MIAWKCLVGKDCERVELEDPQVDEDLLEVLLHGNRIFQVENENDNEQLHPGAAKLKDLLIILEMIMFSDRN